MKQLLIIFSTILSLGSYAQVSIVDARGTDVVLNPYEDPCIGSFTLLFEPGLSPYQVSVMSANDPDFVFERTISKLDDVYAEYLTDLCEGTYYIQVHGRLGCDILLSHTVNACGSSSGGFFEINAVLTQPTSSYDGNGELAYIDNGSIELVMDFVPATIKWFEVRPHFSGGDVLLASGVKDLSGLGNHQYRVEVSNGCYTTSEIYTLFYCAPSGQVDIEAVVSPSIAGADNGRIAVEFPNISELISLSWDNGEGTPVIENLAPGTYCVDGVAKGNVCFSACYQVEIAEYSITTVEPSCEGMSNGEILIEYEKSTEDHFEVYVDGLPYTPTDLPASGTTSRFPIFISGLGGDREYQIEIIAGDVTVSYRVYVPTIPLEKRYIGLSDDDSFDELINGQGYNTCQYDLLCKGTPVQLGGKEQVSFVPGAGDRTAFNVCKQFVKCGGEEYDVRAPRVRDMPVWIYRDFLDHLVETMQIFPDYRDDILLPRVEGIGPCQRIDMCMGDFSALNRPVFKKPNSSLTHSEEDGDCLKFRCGGIFNRKFCNRDILASFGFNLDQVELPPSIVGCRYYRLPALTLIRNRDVLETAFTNTFFGSQLDQLLAEDPSGHNFRICDHINFCACSFEVIEIIKDPLCDQNVKIEDGSFKLTCHELPEYQTANTTRGICRVPENDTVWNRTEYIDLNGIIVPVITVVAKQGFKWRTIETGDAFVQDLNLLRKRCGLGPSPMAAATIDGNAASIVAGTLTSEQFITDGAESENLLRFAPEHVIDVGEEYKAPFGIVQSDDARMLYDLNMFQREVSKEEIPTIDHLVRIKNYVDEQVGSAFIEEQTLHSQYRFHMDINDVFQDLQFQSSSYVDFLELVASDTMVHLFAAYQGELFIGDTLIASNGPDTALIVLSYNFSGHLVSQHELESVDWQDEPSISHWADGITLGTSVKSNQLVIDGISESLGLSNYAILSLDVDGTLRSVRYEPDYSSVLDVARSQDGEYSTASFTPVEPHISANDTSFLKICRISSTTNLEVTSRTFYIQNFSTSEFDMDYIFNATNPSEKTLVIGITFEDTIIIDDQTIVSAGGKDILVMTLDQDLNVETINRFGSLYDENVSQILATYYEPDNARYIFFGGEFSSKIFRRDLGDITLINTKKGMQKAYVTFMKLDGVPQTNQPGSPVSLLVEDVAPTGQESEVVLRSFPNPFDGAFELFYQSDLASKIQVQIFDAYGRRVYEERLHLDAGALMKKIALRASSGFYFIKVRDDLGNVRTKKVLCSYARDNAKDD